MPGRTSRAKTVDEVRRFLVHWLDKMRAVYVAMSLPPEFRYPTPRIRPATGFIRECLMPVLAEKGKPWAMMIGARLRVNPGLREGGDATGIADVMSVVNLCHDFPQNKFMVTMLARGKSARMAAAGRKFGNLLPFGCWWFLNNPSLVEEITRMRLELLGTMFVPQHSDARVLDQLIYKWEHSRRVIAKVLVDKYVDLTLSGYTVTAKHVQRDWRSCCATTTGVPRAVGAPGEALRRQDLARCDSGGDVSASPGLVKCDSGLDKGDHACKLKRLSSAVGVSGRIARPGATRRPAGDRGSGQWTPSAANTQPWEFRIVGGECLKTLRDRLREAAKADPVGNPRWAGPRISPSDSSAPAGGGERRDRGARHRPPTTRQGRASGPFRGRILRRPPGHRPHHGRLFAELAVMDVGRSPSRSCSSRTGRAGHLPQAASLRYP